MVVSKPKNISNCIDSNKTHSYLEDIVPKIIQKESLIHSKKTEIVQRDQVNTPGGYKEHYLTTWKTGEVPVRP